MATISGITKDRLENTDKFLEKGGTLTELLKDQKFIEICEKERLLKESDKKAVFEASHSF